MSSNDFVYFHPNSLLKCECKYCFVNVALLSKCLCGCQKYLCKSCVDNHFSELSRWEQDIQLVSSLTSSSQSFCQSSNHSPSSSPHSLSCSSHSSSPPLSFSSFSSSSNSLYLSTFPGLEYINLVGQEIKQSLKVALGTNGAITAKTKISLVPGSMWKTFFCYFLVLILGESQQKKQKVQGKDIFEPLEEFSICSEEKLLQCCRVFGESFHLYEDFLGKSLNETV